VNVLLVPAHPGFPGQIPQSRKTVVCVCVMKLGMMLEVDETFMLIPLSRSSEVRVKVK